MLAKRGLSQASLILDWAAIVGARTAALCEPARLQWPPRGPKTDPAKAGPATLWLRVAPGRALDIQYQGPVIVERVNAHFGWRCIAGVKIRARAEAGRRRDPAGPAGRPSKRSDGARTGRRNDADRRRRGHCVPP